MSPGPLLLRRLLPPCPRAACCCPSAVVAGSGGAGPAGLPPMQLLVLGRGGTLDKSQVRGRALLPGLMATGRFDTLVYVWCGMRFAPTNSRGISKQQGDGAQPPKLGQPLLAASLRSRGKGGPSPSPPPPSPTWQLLGRCPAAGGCSPGAAAACRAASRAGCQRCVHHDTPHTSEAAGPPGSTRMGGGRGVGGPDQQRQGWEQVPAIYIIAAGMHCTWLSPAGRLCTSCHAAAWLAGMQ